MTTMAGMTSRGRTRRIGLALGAGGARGLAHVGVLKVFAEEGLPVDCIVGTSSGAMVGAVYAAGQLETFERIVLELEWTDVLALWDPVWPRSGLMSGSRTVERLSGMVGDWKIQDLPIPFAAVAVDLVTGDEILIREGRVRDAVRASISIPGIFVPVRKGRQVLVDGAIRNPVPVSDLGELGADVRVAVNLHHDPVREIVSLPGVDGRRSSIASRVSEAIDTRLARFRRKDRSAPGLAEGKRNVPNLFEILTASMTVIEYELAQYRLARDPVDVLIEPDLHGIRAFEFHKAKQAIAAGRRAAEEKVDEVKRALRKRRRLGRAPS